VLALRPNCEACDRDLAADARGAMICSFECTFCEDCARDRFGLVCPNCGGKLVERPARPARLLDDYPGSVERVTKDHGAR
jgi:hypothetical protein